MRVYGVFDPNRTQQHLTATLARMSSTLRSAPHHRSDDFVTRGLGIGRIYSQELSQDTQPVWNEEHTKFIVMVGRIFDCQQGRNELLRMGHHFRYPKSDAEFVLHSLEQWGNKSIERLNGVFTFAFYDDLTGTLTVANDRYGMKPLYYHYEKPKFTFASQVKAVIADTKVIRKINWSGWRDYFFYGYLLGTKTLFEDVYSLPNATILTVTEDGVSLSSYWSYTAIAVDHCSSEEQFISKGVALIRQSIQRQCRDLRECTVLLSGGYDSRCITCALKHYTNVAFETFTTCLLHSSDVDRILVREIAKVLKVANTYIARAENLHSKYLTFKVFLLDGMCAEHLDMLPLVGKLKIGKVNFDGLGGGELLRGGHITRIPNWRNLMRMGDLRKLAIILDREMRRDIHRYVAPGIPEFFHSPIREKLRETADPVLQELSRIGPRENVAEIFFMTNRNKNALSLSSQNIVGTKGPCFLPFLDNDLVEFSLTIPPSMKIKNELYFKMLRKMFPDVMKVPSTNFLGPFSLHHILFQAAHCSKRKVLSLALHMARFLLLSRVSTRTRELSRAEIRSLTKLLDLLRIPEFVDLVKLRREIEAYMRHNKDPMALLVPMLEFCIWYNMFYLGETGLRETNGDSARDQTHQLNRARTAGLMLVT